MFPSTSRKRTKAKQESNWGYVKYALNAHESFMASIFETTSHPKEHCEGVQPIEVYYASYLEAYYFEPFKILACE